jgi:hypothetical protein
LDSYLNNLGYVSHGEASTQVPSFVIDWFWGYKEYYPG